MVYITVSCIHNSHLGDALEDMPIKVDVVKRESPSAKIKDLHEEVDENTAAKETVVTQNDNTSEKTSDGRIGNKSPYFIHSFIYSFIYLSIYLFIYSFIYSLIQSFLFLYTG